MQMIFRLLTHTHPPRTHTHTQVHLAAHYKVYSVSQMKGGFVLDVRRSVEKSCGRTVSITSNLWRPFNLISLSENIVQTCTETNSKELM